MINRLEQKKLLQKYHEGQPEQLLKESALLISCIVNKYCYSPEQREDCLASGYLGLIEAINKYQPLGCPFLVFAGVYIKQFVIKHIRESCFPFVVSKKYFKTFAVEEDIDFLEQLSEEYRNEIEDVLIGKDLLIKTKLKNCEFKFIYEFFYLTKRIKEIAEDSAVSESYVKLEIKTGLNKMRKKIL